jgi:hypothetical protein
MDSFSADGKIMDQVLAMQNRFRSFDWGDISAEQLQANATLQGGKGALGRYPTDSEAHAIIITDEGSEFRVRYEDEPAE